MQSPTCKVFLQHKKMTQEQQSNLSKNHYATVVNHLKALFNINTELGHIIHNQGGQEFLRHIKQNPPQI